MTLCAGPKIFSKVIRHDSQGGQKEKNAKELICRAAMTSFVRSVLVPLNFSQKRSGVYPVKPVRFLFNRDVFNRGISCLPSLPNLPCAIHVSESEAYFTGVELSFGCYSIGVKSSVYYLTGVKKRHLCEATNYPDNGVF